MPHICRGPCRGRGRGLSARVCHGCVSPDRRTPPRRGHGRGWCRVLEGRIGDCSTIRICACCSTSLQRRWLCCSVPIASRPAPTVRLVNRAFCELTGPGCRCPDRPQPAGAAQRDRARRDVRRPADRGDHRRALCRPAAAALGRGMPPSRRWLSGQALGQRPDNYAIWLDMEAAEAAPAARADPFRLLASLSGECFYELAVEVDCGLRLVWADARLVELTGYDLDEFQAMGGVFSLVASRRPARATPPQPAPADQPAGPDPLPDAAQERRAPMAAGYRPRRADRRGRRRPPRRRHAEQSGGRIHSAGAAGARRLAALLADTLEPACSCSTSMGAWSGPATGRPSPWAPAARSGRPEPELGAAGQASGLLAGLAGRGGGGRQPLRCRLGWPAAEGDWCWRSQLAPLGDELVQVRGVAGPVAGRPRPPWSAARPKRAGRVAGASGRGRSRPARAAGEFGVRAAARRLPGRAARPADCRPAGDGGHARQDPRGSGAHWRGGTRRHG